MPNDTWFDGKIGSAGTAQGPRLRGSLFIPAGMGCVFEDSNGTCWMQRLAKNADGTTLLDENGRPTLELQQVDL